MRTALKKAAAVSMFGLLVLGGCSKEPTGQVVAVVNGEEITLQELNAEIADLKLPPNADKKQVQASALQRIIDRRLMALSAKEAGLDKDPEYILRERRGDEAMLVQLYAKRAMDAIRVPDAAAIDKYIAANPEKFAQRTQMKIDQIAFPVPSDPNSLKALEPAKTMDAVVAKLQEMNIQFKRGEAQMDTATVPPQMLTQIEKLPPGEPFIVPLNGFVTVNVITGKAPVQIAPDEARAIAAQAIRADELRKVGEQRLKEAQAKAKVEYQAGYAPPAKK
jgi:EpsD family peptidyl-prolyl cis-trans isomerase